MKYTMSTNVAVRIPDIEPAVAFYSGVLGFNTRSRTADEADLDAAPLTLFVIADQEPRGPVMELFVDDLEAAREELLAHGCKVLRWEGKGRDCYIQDPFGLVFNLWETRAAD